MTPALSRDDLVHLLTRVGAYLDSRDVTGEICVVGGAAMALAFNSRRLTGDVDGVFEPTTIIREAAAAVAAESGMAVDDDWLNDAAKGLLPPGPVPIGTIMEVPGLRITVPPADYLLATKVSAARTDRDTDDIEFLAGELSLNTSDEVLAVVTAHYPLAQILPKSRFLIEQIFGPLRQD